jgi:hypothetical protein
MMWQLGGKLKTLLERGQLPMLTDVTPYLRRIQTS